MRIKQWERNVVLGCAGDCGEGQNTSSLKTPVWEAIWAIVLKPKLYLKLLRESHEKN